MDEKVSNFWILDVRASGQIKIVFDHPVNLNEAITLFNNGGYEDILYEDLDITYVDDGWPG